MYFLIFNKKDGVCDDFTKGLSTIGFRMPNSKAALKVLEKFGPLATTSVNISNNPPINNLEEIIKYFGDKESFEKQIERDWRKIKLCEQNGVKLLHFAFLKEKEFENCGYELINDVDKLISIIKEREIYYEKMIETYEKMVEIVTEAHIAKKARGGRKNKISVEKMVLMTLEYLREYRTYFHIGKSYGVSESYAYKIIKW